jgi:chromosome segregation protein
VGGLTGNLAGDGPIFPDSHHGVARSLGPACVARNAEPGVGANHRGASVHLKTLTLKGFKSFADTTSLDLEPGVTVVVGPNGSGKSNVVDAVSWVLGAQAPSLVRSQKMDDVIFAGTDKRQPLGRAEVSLTIDNSDGQVPIEFNEVTIRRTLFRTGDSEYAINNVPCRMLDIQELLSDAGVGKQQHVIISQGQIDAVLNAKPEERRLIIEEAAGVLKHRKRKEKSERRLASTDGNLTRLQDLLREVRRQLRPLEKQADAARRHGALVEELTALRIYVAGRELESLRAKLTAGEQVRTDHTRRDRELKTRLAELDTSVLRTEARLSAMGGDHLGDDLAQFESLFQRSRGLSSLLTERRRGIERDRAVSIDSGVVFALEAEGADIKGQLAAAEAEAESLAPQAAALAEAEAALVDARQRFERDWAEDVVAPSGHAAEVRGELAALRSSALRAENERNRVATRLAGLDEKTARTADEVARLSAELAAAEEARPPLVAAVDAARGARGEAESALAYLDEEVGEAQAEHRSWTARVDALSLALDQARSKAGAERLAAVDGVLGTLLDLVDVDPGWEAAFEAAAGEALAAVVIDGLHPAREAIRTLHGESISGAVLALQTHRPARTPPPVGEPVRSHVRASTGRPDVERLLDALIGHAVRIAHAGGPGWLAGLDAAIEHPDAIVVTDEGDRFGLAGWRVGVAGTGATGAALDEARERAEQAGTVHHELQERRRAARTTLDEARRSVKDLSRRLDEADRRITAAANARQKVENGAREAAREDETLRGHLAELTERLTRERGRIGELEQTLPALEAEENAQAERGRAMGEARSRLDDQASAVAAMRSDLEVRTAQIASRRQLHERRMGEIDQRLEHLERERREAEARRIELDRRAVVTDRLISFVIERTEEIELRLVELREQRRRQSDAVKEVTLELDRFRRDRGEAERGLAQLRELQQRAEIDEAETRLRLESAVETLRRDLDIEPDVAIAAPMPELPDAANPKGRIRELERELKIMGAINPLALQEFEELRERHDFIAQQLSDVKDTRRELQKIIRAIDDEIVNVFAAAFADVSQNFVDLFATLFPGGKGGLRLTDPDNLLETGIEVEAKPSGKNVKKLSLLSGGERSLTALAFLFAVFRSRPSPFYVMDEVEAALDDVNLHRFLDLVGEFRNEAQLIIVSHQKRTMEAADCLYGVTMQPGGSSRVVSEKVSAGR